MTDLGTRKVWKFGSSLSIALPKDFALPGETLWVRAHLDGTIEYSRKQVEFAMPIVVRLKPPATGVVTLPSIICRTHGIKQGDSMSMYTDSYSIYIKKESE